MRNQNWHFTAISNQAFDHLILVFVIRNQQKRLVSIVTTDAAACSHQDGISAARNFEMTYFSIGVPARQLDKNTVRVGKCPICGNRCIATCSWCYDM